MNKVLFGSKIILNVVLAATFLTVFFFTYVTYVERKVIEHQVRYIVINFKKQIKNFSPAFLDKLEDKIRTAPREDLSVSDHRVKEANDKIFKNVSIIMGIVFGITLIGLYAASIYGNFSYWSELIKPGLFILFSVAFAEYIFLTFYGGRAYYADNNAVSRLIIDKLTT